MVASDTILALVAGLVGSIVAILAVLALDLLRPRHFCPDYQALKPPVAHTTRSSAYRPPAPEWRVFTGVAARP